MNKVVREGDVCTGHGGYPSRGCSQGSPDVFVNGLPVHRVGDKWDHHDDGNGSHDAIMLEGANGVYVNGRPIAMTGCEISCGSKTHQGSDDVLVYNSPAYPEPLITEDTDDCSVTRIPRTMRAKGWHRAANLMDQWFFGEPNRNKSAVKPDSKTITWAWLLGFGLAKERHDQLLETDYLFKEIAQDAIVKNLRDHGKLTGEREQFGNVEGDIFELHKWQFQHAKISIIDDYVEVLKSFDELAAALGSFAFYASSEGFVEPEGSGYRVTVERVAVYIRDHYDFEETPVPDSIWEGLGFVDQEDYNFLGSWNFKSGEISWSQEATEGWCPIYNEDFRNWREQENHGKDYYVTIIPEIVETNVSFLIDAP